MRFLFIARPQFPVPPERVPALIADFETWWATYREKWVAAGFFAGGGGGGGVCEVADATEFYQMMPRWPFAPYNATETFPIIDIDTALALWRETASPS